VRRTLRKAWDLDDAAEAEGLIMDLARRMEKEAPGVSGSILKGLDEILTVNRLLLPPELRRSLACTNAIENMQGTIRCATRNVKRWRDASMAPRWAADGMLEAKAGLRRLKAHRQLPSLRLALAEHRPRRSETTGELQGLPCSSRVRLSVGHPEPAGRRMPDWGLGRVKTRVG
jgi:putative transposase